MVSLDDIHEARHRIDGITVRTPLIPLEHDGAMLYLKPENLQPIGAFKLRGAYNKIASLSEEERARGVITYSSGNHAQGVAYAARAVGAKAVIVMPRNAPAIKREATAALGAEIVFVGPSGPERQIKAEQLAAEHGYIIVPQYVGTMTFEHIRRYVDDVVTVSEDDIMQAVRVLAENPKTVAEPSGAVATAAWLFHRDSLPQSNLTVAVISGGNIDPTLLKSVRS